MLIVLSPNRGKVFAIPSNKILLPQSGVQIGIVVAQGVGILPSVQHLIVSCRWDKGIAGQRALSLFRGDSPGNLVGIGPACLGRPNLLQPRSGGLLFRFRLIDQQHHSSNNRRQKHRPHQQKEQDLAVSFFAFLKNLFPQRGGLDGHFFHLLLFIAVMFSCQPLKHCQGLSLVTLKSTLLPVSAWLGGRFLLGRSAVPLHPLPAPLVQRTPRYSTAVPDAHSL